MTIWLRRIASPLAGFGATALLSFGTDELLYSLEVLPRGPHHIYPLHILELSYRCLWAVAGGWIAARLAPDHPMRHALALATFAFLVTGVGTAATWNMGLGPAWFAIGILVLTPLCIVAGARIVTRRGQLTTSTRRSPA